jgi:hypothetical protein
MDARPVRKRVVAGTYFDGRVCDLLIDGVLVVAAVGAMFRIGKKPRRPAGQRGLLPIGTLV